MERPIIFSGPMVQAILAGRKTQTRRIIKPQPVHAIALYGADGKPSGNFGLCLEDDWVIDKHVRCPYGAPGDRLWVRETWGKGVRPCILKGYRDGIECRADVVGNNTPPLYDLQPPAGSPEDLKRGWRPSIHMPRWASRITLRVTEIRVERLQAITEDDARAEGGGLYVPGHGFITEDQLKADPGYANFLSPVTGFVSIWDSINGAGAWNANPYVWVVKFEREENARG